MTVCHDRQISIGLCPENLSNLGPQPEVASGRQASGRRAAGGLAACAHDIDTSPVGATVPTRYILNQDRATTMGGVKVSDCTTSYQTRHMHVS